MAKKGILVLFIVVFLAGGIFAQDNDSEPAHKHEAFDMLLGLNLGYGATLNFAFMFAGGDITKGNYSLGWYLGLTYDFYLFPWLSFNSGLLLHPDMYLILSQDLNDVTDFTEVVDAPFCLTIPLMAHINIPKVEWLYAGVGLNINIPLFGMFDALVDGKEKIKRDAYIGIPIDFGFDFTQPRRGGMRLVIRVTPEIHKGGTTVPVGIIWQIWNWQLNSKK